MKQINSYLTFNGNCREAMNFYKECLGGKLNLQTIGESPMADKMPATMKHSILHSELRKGNVVLMGSDMVSEGAYIKLWAQKLNHLLTRVVLTIVGGDEEDRTPGLGIANAALSQLSYIPDTVTSVK